MGAIASQITSLTIVYSIVHSGADQRQHQRSASLAFVQGIHRWPVNSPHKWPVTLKMFPFDDVIMIFRITGPVWGDFIGYRCIYLSNDQYFGLLDSTSYCSKRRLATDLRRLQANLTPVQYTQYLTGVCIVYVLLSLKHIPVSYINITLSFPILIIISRSSK